MIQKQADSYTFHKILNRERKMASSGNCLLPEDAVIEILSRLPVKSLLRFKSVCKYWYNLIKSSDFTNKQLHHYSNHARLLVHHYIPETDKGRFALFPDETLAGQPPVHQDLDYIEIPPCLDHMLGSVNGLFLFHRSCFRHSNNHIALWNPATREFRSLPIPGTNLPPHFTCATHKFGFGCDPLTNDYKVVWIRCMWDEEMDLPVDPVITLYTLANDSWRHLEIPNTSLDSINLINSTMSASATYFNGAYYWLSCPNDRSYYKLVLFDMSSDVFREIKGPENTEPNPLWGQLVLYNDSIALFRYECSEMSLEMFDIWVMEQEGLWTKLFTLGPLSEFFCPLGIWINGEIFFETSSSQVVIYDSNNNDIRNIGIQGKDGGGCLWVSVYKESLVSVNDGFMVWDQDNYSEMLQDFFKCSMCLEEKNKRKGEAIEGA